MIIGIDETGDFSANSDKISFFIAVLLTQNNNGIQIKRNQFNEWLETISKDKKSESGEVKGSDLNDSELLDFVKNVYNEEPIVRVEVVSLFPSENPESIVQKFKEIEVNALLNDAKKFRENGDEKKAKSIEKMSIWLKNRKKMNYNHFMKMTLLKSIINNSFITSIGISILTELTKEDLYSENLLNLEFKIDSDFIKGDEANKNWKKILERSFIAFNKKNPIPTLTKWKNESHAFLEKYKTENEELLNFSDIFKNLCNFNHSHNSFEIQMADIVGIIINRNQNLNKAIEPYEELWKIIEKPNFKKIRLNL